jgi:hypothetical protein
MISLANIIRTNANKYTGASTLNIGYYGDALTERFGAINENTNTSLMQALLNGITGKTVNMIEIPSLELRTVTGNGLVVLDPALTSLQYATTPRVKNSGRDEQNEKEWTRYWTGTIQAQADAEGAILLQPITFAS